MLRPWKLEITLEPQSSKALYLQIADAIVAAIQSGRLKAGDPLPGSRPLSQLLSVNRNTIVEALNVLHYEGWLRSEERKGTFIADISMKEKPTTIPRAPHSTPAEDRKETIPYLIFDDGNPDSKIAPSAELARAYRQIFTRQGKWQMLRYGNAQGDPEFRSALTQMLNHQRGMHLKEEMLCVTRGSQMAIYLAAQCMFKKGDCVVVEDPGYSPAWQTLAHVGVTLIPIPVDEKGLQVDKLATLLKNGTKIKAVYTTPHRQYPTTVPLSLQRRLALVKLSNSYSFTIIEDDYDNEFHYGYRPIMPLASDSNLRNYIYIGTLSKVVAPALRTGYLATNDAALMSKIIALRKLIDVQSDSIMEQAILQLMKDGTLKRHIKKATSHYKEKRDYTVRLLETYLRDKITYQVPEGGLAFWIVPKKTN